MEDVEVFSSQEASRADAVALINAYLSDAKLHAEKSEVPHKDDIAFQLDRLMKELESQGSGATPSKKSKKRRKSSA